MDGIATLLERGRTGGQASADAAVRRRSSLTLACSVSQASWLLDAARPAREPYAVSVILAEGTVFARRYRVVRLIAAGAMGAVHEVVHLETERHRALKVMHAHLFQSEEMRERFKREARIAAKVDSEYIVDVFDAGIDEATSMPFLVMELLRGEELGERLKRAGRLPPQEAMTYLYQTALALERTHAASIVHRDLKPANLFLSQREDGSVRVKILDFGIAKLVAEGTTAAGDTSSLGTPIYMPPEQFLGGTRLTAAADIFALGMMAYTLLVGIPYWQPEASSAENVFAFAMVAARGPDEPPVQRARSQGVVLPPGFDAWFARATAGDPAARFRRAMEAVQALGETLGIPVDGGRGTFQSAPSWPGVVPAAIALPAPLVTTVPAPPMSPGRDARSPGLTLVGTSTGAAVSALPSRPAKPSRGPLVGGLAVLGLSVLLGSGSWLALRAGRGGVPAAAGPEVTTESAATPELTTAAPATTTAAPATTTAAPAPSAVPQPVSSPANTPPREPTSKPTPTGPRPSSSYKKTTPAPVPSRSLYGRF
ncbi:protein kinase domain-containing protein [Sorangium sp. So ce131]|uniref:serine/threonine-protein kinase n=1 Tax=Sorangium sp. So ce131 TaxID=3133282 RepID=UPI003F5E4962